MRVGIDRKRQCRQSMGLPDWTPAEHLRIVTAPSHGSHSSSRMPPASGDGKTCPAPRPSDGPSDVPVRQPANLDQLFSTTNTMRGTRVCCVPRMDGTPWEHTRYRTSNCRASLAPRDQQSYCGSPTERVAFTERFPCNQWRKRALAIPANGGAAERQRRATSRIRRHGDLMFAEVFTKEDHPNQSYDSPLLSQLSNMWTAFPGAGTTQSSPSVQRIDRRAPGTRAGPRGRPDRGVPGAITCGGPWARAYSYDPGATDADAGEFASRVSRGRSSFVDRSSDRNVSTFVRSPFRFYSVRALGASVAPRRLDWRFHYTYFYPTSLESLPTLNASSER